jgi:hypothetical protein
MNVTLTVAEIIEEVRREAERKHGVPDEMAQNWPRFPLVKVVPLCDEIERLTAQTDAIADEWQRENDKLNACRAERDAWQYKHNDLVARFDRAQINANMERNQLERERDALVAQLAKAREAYDNIVYSSAT